MEDSFATVYDDLRTMEAPMECAINDEPLFDEDVPSIIQSHANISISVDATGPFAKSICSCRQQQRSMLLLQ